jgi:maltooligosyltrehalose trehalohydrolase
MFFMGEEYGERAPFLYFVSHGDQGVIEAVRKGRREEFAAFGWEGEPPDPQAEETFLRSMLDWSRRKESSHRVLLEFHRVLLELRRDHPALSVPPAMNQAVSVMGDEVLLVHREGGARSVLMAINYAERAASLPARTIEERWSRILDSSSGEWNGPGARSQAEWTPGSDLTLGPLAAVVYETPGAAAS